MSTTPHNDDNDNPSTPPAPQQNSTTSYLSYPVSHVVSGLYRRLTEPSPTPAPNPLHQPHEHHHHLNPPEPTSPSGVYTPPHRTASPFQPPPLSPLSLTGFDASTSPSAQILSRALAEEIRLLVPPRLQLADTWALAYSLEQDGVSLATLYNRCASPSLPKDGSFVLVIRDAAGGIFGAYLTSPPHPSPTFYGTGECFLWRASLIPSTSLLSISLPPPPSAPTSSSLPRSTTIASPRVNPPSTHSSPFLTTTNPNPHPQPPQKPPTNTSPPSPPSYDRIRFKAFPYSGVNDYLIFCEQSFLSVGGGDGKYGLWLDAVLERGVSGACLTFGNEPLSEEGEKFEVVGVEVWVVGGSLVAAVG